MSSKSNKKNKRHVTCQQCNLTFNSLSLYIDHLTPGSQCLEKSSKCKSCNAIFATKKSMEYHMRTNSQCINLADQMSKIGQEFEIIRPSAKKKARVLDVQNNMINIDINQSSIRDIDATSAINSFRIAHQIQYNVPDASSVNRTLLLSPTTIQNHTTYLKRQFPFGLTNSPSFDRSIFILKIMKLNNNWNNRQLKGTLNGLVNEIKNHIFYVKANSGKESISGYSHPFTFDSITQDELVWFVTYHNTGYIDSLEDHSPDIYQLADDPNKDNDTDNDDDSEDNVVDVPEDFDIGISSSSSSSEVEGSVDTTIYDYVESARRKRASAQFDMEELMLLELFDILREAGAPMYTFDKLGDWAHRNASQLSLRKPMTRQKFFKSISSKVYGDELAEALQPRTETHVMPSTGANLDLVTFSFKAQMATLFLDDDLMSEENLLLNPDDPFTPLVPRNSPYLNDLNSGWWHPETAKAICKNPRKEILCGVIFFADAGKVTLKQSLEPYIFSITILNRFARNLPTSWRTMGYIENLDNGTRSQKKKYNSKMKMKDYHYILSVFLREFKTLQGENGGFKMKLTLRGIEYDIVFKVAVQNVMGDCMGLDKLCLFYGSNSLDTARMCRDCNVPPMMSDDPDYKCIYTKITDLIGLSKEGFKGMSIYDITNAFNDIYFGARQMCIYQCTPGEPLHAILLGLIKYLYEEFEKAIPKATLRLINEIVKYYYRNFSRQSCKDMPSLAPFLGGVDNCDVLGGKEQYARLFGIFIALNNREVIHSLCTQARHVYDETEQRAVRIDPMSLEEAKQWYNLFESTLIMYQWIMLPTHKKSYLTPPSRNRESKGQLAIRKFMREYKALVENRGGHGVKLLKFHQLLHYTKQILKDGSVQNIDTGRCESIAVTMYKRISIWTQRRQMLLTRQIASRHLECVTAVELGRMLSKFRYSQGRSYVPHEPKRITGLAGSTFTMTLIDSADDEFSYLRKTLLIEWKGVPVNASYHSLVFQNLTKRLFLNTDDGGCLTHDSKVIGKTEYISEDGTIYRAHPNYRSDGMWYDWCKVKWEKKKEEIPAKIIMFIDLTECDMMTEDVQNEMRDDIVQEINEIRGTSRQRRFANRDRVDYLEKGHWVVIRSAFSVDDSKEIYNSLTDREKKYTMESKITHKILLEDECRIVPIDTISCPCYVLPGTFAQSPEHCHEFFVVDKINTWGDKFV